MISNAPKKPEFWLTPHPGGLHPENSSFTTPSLRKDAAGNNSVEEKSKN